MRSAPCVRLLALALPLCACGGGEPSDGNPAPKTESAQAAARAHPGALPRIDAALLYLQSPAPNETAFHGCMRRLNVALRSNAVKKDIDIGCLAGSYFGQTYQGEGCALRVVPNAERAGLVLKGNVVELEVAPLRVETRERSEFDVQWTDVEVGHLGLQFFRRSGDKRVTSETVVLTSGPREEDKPATADDMTYERVEAGRVVIVRCRFDV
jgi:hypothetical protein